METEQRRWVANLTEDAMVRPLDQDEEDGDKPDKRVQYEVKSLREFEIHHYLKFLKRPYITIGILRHRHITHKKSQKLWKTRLTNRSTLFCCNLFIFFK